MTAAHQKLYEALGYLFYSIAHADEEISVPESEALSRAVKEHWVPVEDETDAFGTDAAFYISICFDYLAEKDISTDAAWHSFVRYYHSHPQLFDALTMERIFRTAKTVVKASGSDAKEQGRLELLEQLVKERLA